MAFVTRYVLYEYTILTLKLDNAPSTFQRLMSDVMGVYINNFVLVYLDYILMFSTTEHEHEYHLRLVFQKLSEYKLQVKLKKCKFGKPHVKYIGHIVGSGEVYVNQDKVVRFCFEAF